MRGPREWIERKLQTAGGLIMLNENCAAKIYQPSTLAVSFLTRKRDDAEEGFSNGMRELARRLESDKSLAEISTIVTDPNARNPLFKTLTRDEFIKRFGSKTGAPDDRAEK